jgi:hypothetical protein
VARRGVRWVRTLAVGSLFGAGLLAVCACYAPTEIDVTISTDVVCSVVRTNAVAIRTAANTSQLDTTAPVAESTTCTDGAGDLGSVTVVPSKGPDDVVVMEVLLGVTRATKDCHPPLDIDGCIVARRRLGFVKHTALKLPISLDHTCIGVRCKEDETCDRAVCVSANVAECPESVCSVGSSSSSGGGGGSSGTPVPDGATPAPDATPPVVDANTPDVAEAGDDASKKAFCAKDCKSYDTMAECQAGCTEPTSCTLLPLACP